MSEIITSRRSFLVGFGALIAAPAICRASSLMPVKQMLILPDKISDVTFPITGNAWWMYGNTFFVFNEKGEWRELNPSDVYIPSDANSRWERMKAREQKHPNHGRIVLQ